jgi:hypothetical protein
VPAVDVQAAERFVAGAPPVSAAPSATPAPPAAPAPKAKARASSTPLARQRRSTIVRADGRELRRTTVYLTPELRKRLAVYAAEQDTDISSAIVEICTVFLDKNGH